MRNSISLVRWAASHTADVSRNYRHVTITPIHATNTVAARRTYATTARRQASLIFPGYTPDALDAPLATAHHVPVAAIENHNTAAMTEGGKPDEEEDPNSSAARARQVFKPLRGDPAERRAFVAAQSTLRHGVLVPPRPDEPENCCMSGCVNCVWDEYREEMEEYVARRKESERAASREKEAAAATVASSMEDDGMPVVGMSDGGVDDELFADIPVGIREFMKIEKKLKQRQQQQQEAAGG